MLTINTEIVIKNVSWYDYVYQTTIYSTYKMGEVKQINIRNRIYYFYNDIIDFENFEARLLKMAKNHSKALIFTTLDM